MTLYEEFKEKYLRDELIDFFIEKRKFILENKKKDYLNYLIKEGLLEEDIINVAKMSLDFFELIAQTILIHDREIFKVYSNLDKKQRSMLLSEINNKLCCMVLNQVTYNVELKY
ncbi:MAG: hypothetical protein ACLRVU_00850 [Beduini sp.]|uniref:hypothetical protein n=1 Tax=Beduini sp. TaxID=1922300 RepID=UPI0039A0C494